ENGTPREVDVFKEAARLADNVAKHEVDHLNVGLDPRAAVRLEGVEQTIGMRDWVEQCSAWGSIGFFWSMGQDSTVPGLLNKIKVYGETLFGQRPILIWATPTAVEQVFHRSP